MVRFTARSGLEARAGLVARTSAAVYAMVCVALWFVPLLNRLQVESAAVIATVAFFAAGLDALSSFRSGLSFGRELGRQLAALAVPLVLMTVAALWAPNCTLGQGLAFFVLFPVPSVILACAVAFAVDRVSIRPKKTVFAGLGVALAFFPLLYDIGFHPQFYSYNPVFGGFLGPIYDEELVIRPGLVVYRLMTVVWAVLIVATTLSGRGVVRRPLAWFALVFLLAGYLAAPRLGINTTHEQIHRTLGGAVVTPHFEIYYDPKAVTPAELQMLAEDHEYRYHVLAARLGVEVPGRIRSYLYPDPEPRARLTGARYTNVAPVWLRQPQTHVLREAYTDVFPHELAHVFSRGFGLPVLRASLSVGLVEGFAEAMEPPSGRPSLDEQVLAAATAMDDEAAMALQARRLADRLSPLGFWTGRGAVSYTMMGSFVSYLIEAYGVERFMAVYALGDFDRVYGKTVDVLAGEWEQRLADLPALDIGVRAYVVRRFSRPSLFERECPHYVPPHERAFRDAESALAAGDTLAAVEAIDRALEIEPRFEPAQTAWAVLRLAEGDAGSVLERYGAFAVSAEEARADTVGPGLQLVLADALALAGRPDEARGLYGAVDRAVPPFLHHDRAILQLRALVADDPATVRILRGGALPGDKADALASAGPAAYLRSHYLAAAERFDEAVTALDTAIAAFPPPTPEIGRQQHVWRAQFLYRAGRIAEARTALDAAIAAFEDAGALQEVRRLADFSSRLAYIERHPVRTEPLPTP